MKPAQTGGSDYGARIRRAGHLASAYPFAAEVLAFYVDLATFQRDFYGKIRSSGGAPRIMTAEGQLRSELKLGDLHLLGQFPAFLALLENVGPAPVAEAARAIGAQSPEQWTQLLTDFWTFGGRADSETEIENSGAEPLEEFVLRAFLQPHAEFLGARISDSPLAPSPRVCPRCGSAPLLGVLRPEGDGGKRRLLCSFCLQEWDFRRIYCAACGEEDEKQLPVYVAEQFSHVRVESCDTCKFYLRTIDLTKDGNAVPIVDDLAAIPLSLWAHEHGYSRVQPNLLGT